MDRSERAALAQSIFGNPLFEEIMDEMEAGEVDQAVHAPYNDHEKRQAHLVAVKAIRDLRTQIRTLAEGQLNVGRKAPA